MDLFQYDSLKLNNSFRVLILSPGGPDDVLQGELETVDSGAAGEYEAISYVWGSPSRDFAMVCNGAPILLTRSLFMALKRVRLLTGPRRIWADQVCINQDDVEERSQQVKFMDGIYRNAARILVWLGEDKESIAPSSFTSIQHLSQIIKDHQIDSNALSDDQWASIRALTTRPWFGRVWIIQEIGTRTPATLFWGEGTMEWDLLHSVCRDLTEYHHLRKQVNIQTAKIKYLYYRYVQPDKESRHANRYNFIYELHRARHLGATDPRDRVFAFLGHFSAYQNAQIRGVVANYATSVEDVYCDVSIRSLKGGDEGMITLAAVQHVELPSHSPLSEVPGPEERLALPTWVPDWRIYQSHILYEPTTSHDASRGIRPDLVVDGNSKTLYAKGLHVDTVKVCAVPFEPRHFHVDGAIWPQSIERVWREICGHSDFDLKIPYVNGDSAVFAYTQTLSNGCVALAWQDGLAGSAARDEWLAHSAAYISVAAGRTCTVHEGIRQLAKAGDEYKWARAANGASGNRVFARTKRGRYVLGPKVMKEGDIICVLFGGKLPFCLRPWGERYLLVGECYVHGIMQGEALDGNRGGGQTFSII